MNETEWGAKGKEGSSKYEKLNDGVIKKKMFRGYRDICAGDSACSNYSRFEAESRESLLLEMLEKRFESWRLRGRRRGRGGDMGRGEEKAGLREGDKHTGDGEKQGRRGNGALRK